MAIPVPLRRPGAVPAAQPSAARAHLVERAAILAEATARVGAIEEAYRRASEAATAARTAHEAAEAAVPAAVAAAARHATDVLLGQAGAPPTSVAAARAALQAASDDLETASAVRLAVENEAQSLTGRLPHLRRDVEDAAKRLLVEDAAPAIAALRTEVESLRRQLADKAAAVNWLNELVWPQPPHIVSDFHTEAPPTPVTDRWQRALDALMADPNAEVPR